MSAKGVQAACCCSLAKAASRRERLRADLGYDLADYLLAEHDVEQPQLGALFLTVGCGAVVAYLGTVGEDFLVRSTVLAGSEYSVHGASEEAGRCGVCCWFARAWFF